jgi:CRISPR-associated endonuclease/helicase Cas3
VVGSVIVLDEVQTLPARLLTPLLDVLRELVRHYRVSVVLCTATQPAFEAIRDFQQLQAREIAPNPPELFATLARVNYHWPEPGKMLSWSEIAKLMHAQEQVLAVVNTKRDALTLLEALNDDQAFHLSTLLCGQHCQM